MDGGNSAGGSEGLAELIDRYGESIIGDFEDFYRPLPDMLRSGASPRYILSLIRTLPANSRLVAAMRGGGQFRGWDVDRYLLASILDAIQGLTYVTAKQNGGKAKKPEPTYRPEKAKPTGANTFSAMARSFFLAAKQKLTKE